VREQDLDQSVKAVVDNILMCGPEAVRKAKRLISALENLPLESRIDLAAENLVERRASLEGREGISAFLEKRRPSWVKGRP
jgi:methylglutaconyl-CoA hydratase